MNAIDLLKKQLANRCLSGSYIFYGTDFNLIEEGIKEVLKGLCVSKFAFFEVKPEKKEKNSKTEIKIAPIRDLIKKINMTAAVGETKLAVIRDADLLNQEAANTLLKTLEEPPRNSVIILLSRKLKLLPTIISRCQVLKFADAAATTDRSLAECLNIKNCKLVNVFKRLSNIADREDLPDLFEPLIAEYRQRLINLPNREVVEKIKKIFAAKKDITVTTNKKLVLENLYLSLNDSPESGF